MKASATPSKGNTEKKYIFGILSVKEETTVWNVLSLFIAPMLAVTCGAYTNMNMPYLLQDADYFDIPFERVGTTVGRILLISSLSSLFFTPIIGYAYDIIGRFWFLIPSLFLLIIQMALLPYSAPRLWNLTLFRAIMGCLMRIVFINPLVIDYVKNESRGLGMGIASYGFVFGELLMIVLYEVTRPLSMTEQYLVPAIVVGSLALPLIFLVREPTIKKSKSETDASRAPLWQRVKRQTSIVLVELRERQKYYFCFVSLLVSRLMNVLFAVYVQLWVMSFHKAGILESKRESDIIYRNIVIGTQVVTLVSIPLFGYFSDKANPRIVIPIAFIVRGSVAACFKFVEDPSGWYSYLLCVSLVVSSLIQYLAVEAIFLKNMNKEVRGTLNGIAFFFGTLGTTVFVYFGGVVFDKIAPWAPFMLVAAADAFVIVFQVIFICQGKLSKVD